MFLETGEYNIVIACQKCLGALKENGNNVACENCGASFPQKGSVYYFSKISGSIVPSVKPNAENPQKWSSWRKQNFFFLQYGLAKGGLSRSSLVADIGAGRRHFRKLFENCRYVGVDFYNYEGVSIVTDVNEQLPMQSNAFDFVILSNTLEHISEPAHLLQECFRLLKGGGKALITVPFLIGVHQAPYDFYRYTHFALQYLLEKSGFTEIEILAIGNIADVRRDIAAEYLGAARRDAGVVSRAFLKITNFFFRGIFSVQDKFIRKSAESDGGYFQGYGVIAQKL